MTNRPVEQVLVSDYGPEELLHGAAIGAIDFAGMSLPVKRRKLDAVHLLRGGLEIIARERVNFLHFFPWTKVARFLLVQYI
jgi:hypothetical protein